MFLKYILILSMFSLSLAIAKTDAGSKTKLADQKLEETKNLLKQLLPFHGRNTKSNFSVEKCAIDKSKWMLLLIAKQPFTEKLNFQKECDIEGQYTTKMAIPFPVKFKLQNLKNFTDINFNFLIQIIYEPVPMIKIFMKNGMLVGKNDKIHFELEYAAEIDPLSKDFIKNDKGGTITIKSINNEKVNQKIPIKR